MQGKSQFIGISGQYYVAYCLTVRGLHAAITLGNVPNVDVVVADVTGARLLSIQVKTSQSAYRQKRYGYELREWEVGSSAVGRSSPNLWYALVDLCRNENSYAPNENSCAPIVFLVPSLWVGNFVKEKWTRKRYMLRAGLWAECKERWDRVEGFLKDDPTVLTWCKHIPDLAKDWQWPPATV